jgi:predicted nucleic acid-binding protein
MSGGKVFFDTNVLLYMYSQADVDKQARAQTLFRSCTGRMVLSTQVVQEFYVAGTRKLGLPRRKVQEAAAALSALPLVIIGPAQILSAICLEKRYKISFWDGLILAAAETGGAQVLYTEDLTDGQWYGTVTVRNPFAIPPKW